MKLLSICTSDVRVCNVMMNHHPHAGEARDCQELLKEGKTLSGVYTIQPDCHQGAFQVYCDMTTDGGGWTVIQRRQDGSQDFYLPWNSYVQGFGNIEKEFFLGLDRINQLTANSDSELRVTIESWTGCKKYAKYSSFGVGNSASKYVLNTLVMQETP